MPCSTWERKLAVLVASAQNEDGTAVARTTAMDGGITSERLSPADSLVSAGAAMAMLVKRRAARDLYCMVAVGSMYFGYKMEKIKWM